MISVIGTTDRYALQPRLIEMHKESMNWLSATLLWKRELQFLQRLLEDHAHHYTTVEEKKEIDHFQHLITYYRDELIDVFRKKLRDHENHMASTLRRRDETDTLYYKQHETLMDELKTFANNFLQFKSNLFTFIEQVL